MSNHTPGPWTADDQHNPLIYSDAARAYVAQVLAYTEGTTGTLRAGVDADARLIASAPALLAALYEIANYDPTKWDAATLGNIARAAISHATGE